MRVALDERRAADAYDRGLWVHTTLADALQVEVASAALEMQRTYKTSDGEVAQVTVNTHPSSRYRHSMTMRRVKGRAGQ